MKTFDLEYYQALKDSLSFEEALNLYSSILSNADLQDDIFQELWEDCLQNASKYTLMRNRWNLMTPQGRIEKDSTRTIYHNTWMNSLNILARYMKQQSWDTHWIEILWDRKVYRKRWGDFAGYLILFGTLGGR